MGINRPGNAPESVDVCEWVAALAQNPVIGRAVFAPTKVLALPPQAGDPQEVRVCRGSSCNTRRTGTLSDRSLASTASASGTKTSCIRLVISCWCPTRVRGNLTWAR
jgi:hypothetical protein